MRIITYTCPNCGTVVSANELESTRVTNCPRQTCEVILQFSDLPEGEQQYFVEHRDQYRIWCG